MRLFVIFGGLIVAVLLAALLVPMFVDWTDYRARFEREASALLGQPVRVAGDATARLLPFPSVAFTDVEVGPPEAPVVTAERFAMDVELAPFLSGQVLIFDMRLEKPTVTLTLDETGSPVWLLPETAQIDPGQVTLENASITGGTVTVLDPAEDRVVVATGLDMRLSADSLFGPWRAEGAARINDVPADFTITTGALARDGFALRVAGHLPDQLIRVITDGRIAPDTENDGRIGYAGTLTVLPFAVDHRYRIDGSFTAAPRRLDIEAFEAAFGDPEDPYVINGDAAIFGGAEPGYVLNVTGNQFDMDAVADTVEDDTEPVDLRTRLAAVNDVLAGLPLPTVAGTVSVDLPTVMIDGTAIRDVRIEAHPVGQGERRRWRLDRLQAQLPGRTAVELDGELSLPAAGRGVEEAVFEGSLVIASRQPTGLARWLTGEVDEAIRALPNLGLESQIRIGANRQAADNVRIIAGAARLTGAIERRAAAGRPLISVALSGRDLDLAAVRALGAMTGLGGGPVETRRSVDVSLNLDGARWGDVAIDRLQTEIRSRGAVTEIDKLVIAGLYDAALSGTATIERLATGWAVRLFDVTVNGANGARLAEGLGEHLTDLGVFRHLATLAERDRAAFDEMQLNAIGSAMAGNDADLRELAATISGRMGAADVFVTTNLTGKGGDAPVRIDHIVGSLTHDDALRLAALAGLPLAVSSGADVGLTEPGALTVSVLRQNEGGESARIAFAAGADRLTLEGGNPFAITGQPYAGVLDLELTDAEPWLAAFGHVLPGTGLGTPLTGTAHVQSDGDGWRATAIEAAIAESALTGELALGTGGLAARSVSGDIALDTLDATLIAGVMTGQIAPLGPQTPFAPPLYDDLDIQLALTADRLYWRDIALSDASGRLSMRGGLLTIDDLTAVNAQGGRIAAQGRVQNAAGTISVAGNLSAGALPATALLPDAGDLFEGAFDLDMSVTGAGTTPLALSAALSGTGTIASHDLVIDGLNADLLATLLPLADTLGIDITPEQVAEIARTVLFDGTARLADETIRFTLANGVARAANLALETPDAAMAVTGTVSYDLQDRAAAGDLTIAFDPGADALAGIPAEIGLSLGDERPRADFDRLAAFISQRALERERIRVERMQARLIERERFRRQMRYERHLARLDDETSLEPAPAEPAPTAPDPVSETAGPEPVRQAETAPPPAQATSTEPPPAPPDPFSPQSMQRLIEALEVDRPR